jgi:nucleotide-binding universal stress UspA family protein
MSYKTILVHADLSPAADARYRLAAHLARTMSAHLVGTALTGVSRFLLPDSTALGGPAIAEMYEQMHTDARAALQRFSKVVSEEGIEAVETRLMNDDIDGGMALQATYSDLIVVGQNSRDLTIPGGRYDLPEYLLLTTHRPVLVTPYVGCPPTLTGHALLAWDASLEASRATQLALPLLQTARKVTVAVFRAGRQTERYGEEPGADIALYLARHGVHVEVLVQPVTMDVGASLLSLAADCSADLLVMGCYGHSRFRELLLGGVTATILQSMTLPVLLAH